MTHWFVYISNNSAAQLNKWLVAPNPPLGRHHRVIADDVTQGDRVWFYDAQDRRPGIVSLCEATDEFSDHGPHDAMPEVYSEAMRRRVKPLVRLKYSITKREIYNTSRKIDWKNHPFDYKGNFRQGSVYCHELPDEIAVVFAKIGVPQTLASGFKDLMSAAFPTGPEDALARLKAALRAAERSEPEP